LSLIGGRASREVDRVRNVPQIQQKRQIQIGKKTIRPQHSYNGEKITEMPG